MKRDLDDKENSGQTQVKLLRADDTARLDVRMDLCMVSGKSNDVNKAPNLYAIETLAAIGAQSSRVPALLITT